VVLRRVSTRNNKFKIIEREMFGRIKKSAKTLKVVEKFGI
jgi:transcriptional regulator